jgi:hypothetical protein
MRGRQAVGQRLQHMQPSKTMNAMNESVTALMEPITECQILAETMPDANPEDVAATLETKAQSCVDHLCGCK